MRSHDTVGRSTPGNKDLLTLLLLLLFGHVGEGTSSPSFSHSSNGAQYSVCVAVHEARYILQHILAGNRLFE